jgi:hypothetical protein
MGLLMDRTLGILIGVLLIALFLFIAMLTVSNAHKSVPEPLNNEYAIKAIQQSGYLQEHNIGLDNSSLELLSTGPYIDADGYDEIAGTYRFMTTDGKLHTSHIYKDTPIYYIVIDIDNESLVF